MKSNVWQMKASIQSNLRYVLHFLKLQFTNCMLMHVSAGVVDLTIESVPKILRLYHFNESYIEVCLVQSDKIRPFKFPLEILLRA